MGQRAFIVGLCVAAAVGGGFAAAASAQKTQPTRPPAGTPTKPGGGGGGGGGGGAKAETPALDELVRTRLAQIQAKLGEGVEAKGLVAEINRLSDLYLAYGRFGDGELLREVATARRIITHLGTGKVADAAEHGRFLVAHPQIAQSLALAIRAEDDVAGVYGALKRIRDAYPGVVADKSNLDGLIAAVCVVHDAPRLHPVLGTPIAPNPVEVFDFYQSNKDRMLLDPRELPTELQTYVVDAHASIPEMQWALKNYARNANTSKLYSTIVYDTAAFKYGKERKIMQAEGGYTLQNIKKLGGVCTEQGYFASEVAKSIGAPACLVSGEGSDVDHAWVGVVRASGKGNWWDFSEGRYDEYQDTQGRVIDPQTGRATSDAFVSLSAGLMSTPKAARRAAAALTDAAQRLAAAELAQTPWPPRWPEGEEAAAWGNWPASPGAPVRGSDAGAQLVLLREALKAAPAYEPAWRTVVSMAEKGKLTTAQKSEWAEAVLKMAGRAHQDFALWAIAPMIRTVEPPAEQDRMWTWAFNQFQQRPDLASRVRFEQGRAWERASEGGEGAGGAGGAGGTGVGNNAKAYAAYRDVVARFPNDGRAVLEALARCEELFVRAGKEEQVLGLYEDAFRRIHKPRNMSAAFASSSNFYIVGFRYAELLELAGKQTESRRVKRTIGIEEEKPGNR